jgi:predicted metal-binding protein
MVTFDERNICEKGKELGFFEVVCFAPSLLNPRDDIREICGNGYCQNFGNNWLCPPAAPSIEMMMRSSKNSKNPTSPHRPKERPHCVQIIA